MANLIITGGNFLASSVGILQNSTQYKTALEQEEQQHEEELRLMREQFAKERELARKAYLAATYNDVETYFQELNENLMNSTRDAERDMIDQRNQQFQTLLIASALVLTAVVSAIYEASLPTSTSPVLTRCFVSAIAIALILLLITVSNSIVITHKVTRFMLTRSKQNMDHLKNAIKATKKMNNSIRAAKMADSVKDAAVDDNAPSTPGSSNSDSSPAPGPAAAPPSSDRKTFVRLDDQDIEKAWSKHEEIVHNLLEDRGRIFDEKKRMFGGEGGNNFEDFWVAHCKVYADSALFCFYLGAASTLLAMMIFMSAYFNLIYGSPTASYISTSVLGCTLVLCLSLAFYLRILDPHIEILNRTSDQESDTMLQQLLRKVHRLAQKHRKAGQSSKMN
eukprot:gene25046-30252_t